MISILDPKLWIAAVVLCAASVGLGYWRGNVAGRASVQAKWNAVIVAENIAKEKQRQEYENRIEQAIVDRDEKLKAVQADATAARAAVGGLRSQLSKANRELAQHSQATVLDYATTATELLEECSAEYQRVAEQADGHAADAAALIKAWPSGGGSP